MIPRLGMRVRFMVHGHVCLAYGTGGMIELIARDGSNEFFVETDCGGFFGWTSFASWEPTAEPDVELRADYRAAREAI